jgi:selenocysteine lyase/cysteine desulfurase
LRDRWVAGARPIPSVDILTPDDADLVGAITSFRLYGNGDPDANRALSDALLDEFGLFTVARSGIAAGDCVRVTPALYNLPADMERLVAALRVLAAR